MKVLEDTIDIGEEIIKYAHSQGHTKARQNTIKWEGLKSMSKNLTFTETTSEQHSTTYYGSEKVYETLAKHLTVAEANASENDPITAVSVFSNETGVASSNEPKIYVQDNFLLNTEDEKRMCRITFQTTCKNTAEAQVKFTKTLRCCQNPIKSSKSINTRIRQQTKNTSQISRKRTMYINEGILSNVSLEPKFRASLNPEKGPKKIFLPKPVRHEVFAKIPHGIKIPIEITQDVKENGGTFAVDYYLWGSVQVTVWGKPYKLMITDILDQKYNAEFTRETIYPKTFHQNRFISSSESGVQAVKVTLQGIYECKEIKNEFKLKIPKCILRRNSYSLESLKCNCDTAELPKTIDPENILPLTDKNLAKIVLRWRFILYSFRTKYNYNDDQWLWKAVLNKNTQLSKVATNLKIDRLCRSSTAIDKFLLTLLLWRENCPTIDDLGQSIEYKDKLQQLTLTVIKELYEVGIPVPVLNFLWNRENQTNNNDEMSDVCPLHRFETEPITSIDCLGDSAATKLKAPLPDRVLLRLLQHWPQQDGWIVAALHLGVDIPNIKNLACNDRAFKSLHEKRLTVFKLWRMNHRRGSYKCAESLDRKDGQENCTSWDLCKELHEMGMPKTTYNFLWLDSETTP